MTTLSTDTVLRGLTVNPTGDQLALVGTRPRGAVSPNEIWALRLTPDGNPIGGEFLVHTAPSGTAVAPQIEFDAFGNLYVVWTEGGTAIRARGFDTGAVPAGPAVTLASGPDAGNVVRAARFPNGELVNAWTQAGG